MDVTAQDIQRLYVAYFNRPADVPGLKFQLAAANATSLVEVASHFSRAPEFVKKYSGVTDTSFVSSLYQNLFGRDADLPGLDFWVKLLGDGVVTKASIAMEMLRGAINQDTDTVANKLTGAEAFHAALEAKVPVIYYTGDNANQIAGEFLASITDDASLAAAIAPDALARTLAKIFPGYVTAPGAQIDLTALMTTIDGGNDVASLAGFRDEATAAAPGTSTGEAHLDVNHGGTGEALVTLTGVASLNAAALLLG